MLWCMARTPHQDQELSLLGMFTAEVHGRLPLREETRPRVLSHPWLHLFPRLADVQWLVDGRKHKCPSLCLHKGQLWGTISAPKSLREVARASVCKGITAHLFPLPSAAFILSLQVVSSRAFPNNPPYANLCFRVFFFSRKPNLR